MDTLQRQGGLLSRGRILEERAAGNIIIEPFAPDCVNTTSVDVRLGPHFFREQEGLGIPAVINILDERDVRLLWGEPQYAIPAGEWRAQQRIDQVLCHISDDDLIIPIAPGETVLAHTIEFIGGRHHIGTEMRARSSVGRVDLTVCKCAGWGDLGFTNRWTMEITNLQRRKWMALPVGLRVAQIIFYACEPVSSGTYATDGGKYQTTDDLADLMASWTPDAMIPKLWLDRDIAGGFQRFVPAR